MANKARCIQLGNIAVGKSWDNPQRGRIYSVDGIAPTLNTCGGGNLEPKILEIRERKEEQVRCTPQRRELSEQQSREFDDFVQKLPYEAAQKEKFVQCLWEAGEGIGILRETLPEVQKVWESHDNEQGTRTSYRIRKLTEKECWRLMDFNDEDFEKAAKVNSRTQLYKQAGNSIVVNVLVAILGQLFIGKEDVYRDCKVNK